MHANFKFAFDSARSAGQNIQLVVGTGSVVAYYLSNSILSQMQLEISLQLMQLEISLQLIWTMLLNSANNAGKLAVAT